MEPERDKHFIPNGIFALLNAPGEFAFAQLASAPRNRCFVMKENVASRL